MIARTSVVIISAMPSFLRETPAAASATRPRLGVQNSSPCCVVEEPGSPQTST